MIQLKQIRACVFDAYGTLFDFESTVTQCPDVPDDRHAELTSLWRDKQLQYAWLRTLEGHYVDFWQVTADALEFALDALGIATPALHEKLMQFYLRLDAFPEVPEVLSWLRQSGYKTAILSNGTPTMLDAIVNNAGLANLLDEVMSADAVKAFKTHPLVYEHCLERLKLQPHQVLFHSSNAWDAFGASAFGMRVVWCNRYGQRRERLPGNPDFEIKNLAELPKLLASLRNL
ncbi:MAG TPA: haloacid dehalogenase type II [Trichormus sp.]|jgi:2-haloacid dehalogenase